MPTVENAITAILLSLAAHNQSCSENTGYIFSDIPPYICTNYLELDSEHLDSIQYWNNFIQQLQMALPVAQSLFTVYSNLNLALEDHLKKAPSKTDA